MTLLYLDDRFLDHRTGTHPENPVRIAAIRDELIAQAIPSRCTSHPWESAPPNQLLEVHTQEYLEELERFAKSGGGRIEQDTVMSRESFEVARYASGAACDAVRRVIQGESSSAFCAIRPPGHHALTSAAMGFCLLNHVAVAARYATREMGLNRVLIVDWDVHHGNGTQAIFWEDPQVGFYSMHRWPFYPGTGAANETGAGDGLGTTCNLPIEYGTSRREILDSFSQTVSTFAKTIAPELILISAGFDAHRLDPVGDLGLETEDFATLTEIVRGLASEHCNGKVVSLLEGGYHPAALALSVATHVDTLIKTD